MLVVRLANLQVGYVPRLAQLTSMVVRTRRLSPSHGLLREPFLLLLSVVSLRPVKNNRTWLDLRSQERDDN